jgi:hypothetical protein
MASARLSGGLVVSAERAIHERIIAAIAPELPATESISFWANG